MEADGVLSDEQFGFWWHHSTEDQLLITYHDVSYWLDGGLVVLDFSKALDVVFHSILVSKLQLLGVSYQLVL